MVSTIGARAPYHHLIGYIFISTLLIASYFQLYWVISHWSNQYKSWIETECYPFTAHSYYIENGTKYYEDHYYHYLQVNMTHFNYPCGDDYLFYTDNEVYNSSKYQHDFHAEPPFNIYTSPVSCYVNKDSFKVRAPEFGIDCACTDLCIRCGEGGCSGCYCCNGCVYCVCIATGLASLGIFLCFCKAKFDFNTSKEYNKIRVVELSVLNKDNEGDILLKIKENEEDVY